MKFGVLGCSTIAEKTMIPAIQKSSNAELYMLGSRSNKKSARLSKKFSCKLYGDYESILENIIKNGYTLKSKTASPFHPEIFGSTKNHIFYSE